MKYIIDEYENATTGLKVVFATVQAQKKFRVTRSHREVMKDSAFAQALGITESYVDDEEKILDDYFEARELYEKWLSEY